MLRGWQTPAQCIEINRIYPRNPMPNQQGEHAYGFSASCRSARKRRLFGKSREFGLSAAPDAVPVELAPRVGIGFPTTGIRGNQLLQDCSD